MLELSDRLSRAAGGSPGHLDVDDLRRRADRRRRQHRTVRGIGVVAAALVVIATAVFAVSMRSSTTEVAHPNRTPAGIGEPGRWVPIAEAPIRPSRFSFALWTGTEVVVFATTDTVCDAVDPTNCSPSVDSSQVLATGGAAYDPSTDAWRRISPPPVGFARAQAQVIDGRIYALGRTNRTDATVQLIRYDPRTDTWTRLISSDTPAFGMWEQSTAFGDQLVVYDPSPRRGPVADAAYDTSTATWRELPADPIFSDDNVRSGSRQLVEYGSRLYRFAGVQVTPTPGSIQPENTVHPVERIAVVDNGEWRPLDVASTARESMGTGTWAGTGDHLTMIDPASLNPYSLGSPTHGATSLAFDPTTRRLTDAPKPTPPPGELVGGSDIVSNETTMAVLYSTWGAILDPDTGSWNTIEVPGKQRLRGFASAFAGDQLFFWGGHVDPQESGSTAGSADGWIWTPPTSDEASSPSTSTSPSPGVIGEPGRWMPIATAPIQPRRNAMAVWTGSEVLVFGGFSRSAPTQSVCPFLWSGTALACPDGYYSPVLPRDAAAYDPAKNSWNRIAPVPAGYSIVATNTLTKTRSAAVVDGKVYVVGWQSPTPTSTTRRHLLSYDPGSDDWSVLGPIGSNPRSAWQLTTFGDELVAFPQSVRPGVQSAHLYDPGTEKWRDVPLPTNRRDRGGANDATPLQMIGTKSALYLFYLADQPGPAAGKSGDNSLRSSQPTSSFAARVAVFDGHDWKLFTAPDSSSAQGRWLQTGDRFTMFHVAAPMVSTTDETSYSFGDLIFDPSTNSFDVRPSDPPSRQAEALDHADTVIEGDAVARVHSTLLEVLAPTQDHWLTFDGPSKEILDSFATTWVGDQLFFWGGHYLKRPGKDAAISDRGWIWTPPKSDGTSPSPPSAD